LQFGRRGNILGIIEENTRSKIYRIYGNRATVYQQKREENLRVQIVEKRLMEG
jgi:hypothetical protein